MTSTPSSSSTTSQVTSPGCGNGVVEGGEQCDDGNLANGDRCTSLCVACVRTSDRVNLADGHCYDRVVGLAASWQVAVSTCAARPRGHLVVYESAAEHAAIVEALVRGDLVWVGMSDLATEGVWVPVVQPAAGGSAYVGWRSDEPNGGAGDNCASHYDSTGEWADEPCGSVYSFICEQE
jgi:cysteine-rich repeat protein